LIVARSASYRDVEQLAERIRARFAQHNFVFGSGKTLNRTCSIGFTTYPFVPTALDASAWEQVIDIADQCLYVAKHAGRNAWVGLFSMTAFDPTGPMMNTKFDVKAQIKLGQLVVHTSLTEGENLDWSHGREK
jgi:predicted signal transduction protein with EAL and GGDEF domain